MAQVVIPMLPSRLDKATKMWVPTINTDQAAEFGDLHIIWPGGTPPEDAIAEFLAGHVTIPSDPIIMATGDVALLALIITYCLIIDGRARLLRWHNAERRYRLEEIVYD